jgi:hypothetical protein
MDPSQLAGKQISEALAGIVYRLRGRLHRSEGDVLEEAARRVRRHEALVQDVVPDLRSRAGHSRECDPLPGARITTGAGL